LGNVARDDDVAIRVRTGGSGNYVTRVGGSGSDRVGNRWRGRRRNGNRRTTAEKSDAVSVREISRSGDSYLGRAFGAFGRDTRDGGGNGVIKGANIVDRGV
jgi:hypothetical protein